MKIHRLRTKAMHGSLNLDVRFHERLNLIVGINGSGKTSALNAIDWVLKNQYVELAHTQYDEIAIEFSHEQHEYKLVSARNESALSTTLFEGEKQKFAPINVSLQYVRDRPRRRRSNFLAPEQNERPLWDFLTGLPTLTVITLDRTLTAEIEHKTYSELEVELLRQRETSLSPMDYVRARTSDAYAEYRRQAAQNDSTLKTRIMISSLQSPDSEVSTHRREALSPKEAVALEKTVGQFLSRAFPGERVQNQTQNFFKYISRLSSAGPFPPALQELVQAQYARVENIARAFDEFENANSRAFERLHGYLQCINRFFKDSGKEVFFDEGEGQLFFRLVEDPGPQRPIEHLSSGERQILFLFTFATFVVANDTVVIVDEPELSLHPKWQYDFLDAFLSLCSPSVQLLFATHSPDIVGRHKPACVPLGKSEQ